jgi:uncharacterized membrane protein YjjB (DUF3815 family)
MLRDEVHARLDRVLRRAVPGAAFTAAVMAQAAPPLSVYIATVAGLIVLLPGYTLTVALSELAAEHLSSGTARFAGALVTFLMIGLGVAIGSRLAAAMLGALVGSTASSPAAPAAVALGPPAWLQIAALLLAPLALSVLLRAPRTEIPWIVFIGALGYFGGRLGAEMLEPEVGMFAGALAVGLASGLYERLRKLPGSIPLVPGILMLVPGSIGYRSLTALLAEEVVPGIQTAFRMLLVAASLVAGLLISSALTVERRDRSERSEPATPLVP